MESEHKSALRSELLAAVNRLNLPIHCRGLEEFQLLDDSVLYASSDAKEAVVVVMEDVTWGPALDKYVELSDAYRARPCQVISVPKFLDGRTGQVIDALRGWFAVD